MNSSNDLSDSADSKSGERSLSDVRPYSPISGPETVINPEGRPDSGHPAEPFAQVADPSAWNILFPSGMESDAEYKDPAGLRLAHFEIEHRIRAGGMGAVFLARDISLNRPVALKIMPPRQSLSGPAIKRFRNEAQSAALLDHENIARAYFVGEDKGLHFIAFEFVAGTNIAELIRQHGKLPIDDALNYTLQVASALLHISERGVVHRDIKPSNIIITPKGRAKLVDMGLARNENREGSADLTVAGTTLGTFDYISPEQAKDPRIVDVRSDIYSLGCTLYHMLTGEPPYPEGTMLQKLLDHQGKDAPNPADKNPKISDDLAAIVSKMMASDPQRRYQTAEELMRDLMLVAGTMGLRSLSPEGLVWLSSRPKSAPIWERHLPWMLTVASLVLLVFLASMFPDLHGNRSRNERTVSSSNDDNSTDGNPSIDETPNSENPTEKQTPPGEIAQSTRDDGQNPNGGPAANDPHISENSQSDKTETDGENRVSVPKETIRRGTEIGSLLPNDSAPGGLVPAPKSGITEPGLSPPRNLTTELDQVAIKGIGPSLLAPSSPGRSTDSREAPNKLKTTAESSVQEREEVFIVQGIDGASDQRYRSLEAACTDATDGSKILLRFSGVRVEDRPIRIQGKRITIRAAEGFQPTLKLSPDALPATGYRTRMISVTGGSLELANVNLVLDVNDQFQSETWTLFALDKPESIQLERVTITVLGPGRRRAASVFEVVAGSRTDFNSDMTNPNDGARRPLELKIVQSLVRGKCDLLSIRGPAAMRVSIDESLLALGPNGTVARIAGNMYEPEYGDLFELTLNHVTALVGDGVLRMESDTVPHRLIPVQVYANNNIISGSQESPLIAMSGKAAALDFRKILRWNGKYNYYDRIDELWTIDAPSTGDNPRTLRFADWQDNASIDEVDAHNEAIYWNRLWADLPTESLRPGDVALDPTAPENPAVKGTATGSDAGAKLLALPAPPNLRILGDAQE